MKTLAIVPATGYGKRLGLKVKKPFVKLGNKPLVLYTLEVLDSCKKVDSIMIAVAKSCIGRLKRLVRSAGLKKVTSIIQGGRTRYQSVKNCLKAVDDSFDIVLIHDAARPFVDRSTIARSIALAARFGACIAAVPESDTVKLADADLFIDKTLDRDRVFRAQTPQAFRRDLIVKAYRRDTEKAATDDSRLVEEMGIRVKILEGSYRNIKITTKEDLKFAEALL